MKILVLGGYGTFGGRLVELLADIPDMEILICGRNLGKAEQFCASLDGKGDYVPVRLDRASVPGVLAHHKPDILVDASGPFQDYGQEVGSDPYTIVKACIKNKVNYLDFADAADFVFGISDFEADARKAGVFVLSGVSSFPVLTSAVIYEMEKHMQIHSVIGGIAPSPYAGIGLNVMRAVVGYAGAPIKLLRDGQKITVNGLTESKRFTVVVPGLMPLANLRFSLVDVPDLQTIPPEHKAMTDIWMGAGPIPESLHLMLNFLAKARARFKLPSLEPISPIFHWVLNLMRFGEHRGGMFVQAEGVRDGKPIVKSWHLLAEGDDGPYIPSMSIEAIIRRFIAGDVPASGARSATRALNLADIEAMFEGRSIYTGMRCSTEDCGTVYQRVLGSAFDQLPDQLQALHRAEGEHIWNGEAEVKRGTNALAQLIAGLIGFPAQAASTPVSVKFSPEGDDERWVRTFGTKQFSSLHAIGEGKNSGLVTEQFGPVLVALALVIENDCLYLVPRRWSIFGLSLPRFLLPAGRSFETQKDGVFHFNVTIKMPVVGLIVAYKGWLKPQ